MAIGRRFTPGVTPGVLRRLGALAPGQKRNKVQRLERKQMRQGTRAATRQLGQGVAGITQPAQTRTVRKVKNVRRAVANPGIAAQRAALAGKSAQGIRVNADTGRGTTKRRVVKRVTRRTPAKRGTVRPSVGRGPSRFF